MAARAWTPGDRVRIVAPEGKAGRLTPWFRHRLGECGVVQEIDHAHEPWTVAVTLDRGAFTYFAPAELEMEP